MRKLIGTIFIVLLLACCQNNIEKKQIVFFKSGDTLVQKTNLIIGKKSIVGEFKYKVILDSTKWRKYWRKEIIDSKQLVPDSTIPSEIFESLLDNFIVFYYINDTIKPKEILEVDDVSYFFKVKDYNLDGILDIGISNDPSGNNVNEEIWVNINDKYVRWNSLSGMPLWEVDTINRTITTGWHMSATQYVKTKMKIVGDTGLITIYNEEATPLNDSMKMVKKEFLVDGEFKISFDTIPY